MRAAAGIGTDPFFLRKRTFARDTGSPWKALRSGADFANEDEAGRSFDKLAGDLLRDPRNAIVLGGRTHPEDDGATLGHDRQARSRGHERRRKRLRNRDLVTVCYLVFCATLNYARIRRRPAAQELALASVRLQQRELAFR